MKIVEIKNLVRKDVPIYYRRIFTGIIVVELMNGTVERAINFTVETKPSGIHEVIINEMENIEYPLLPLNKAIKRHISFLDESGGLPK